MGDLSPASKPAICASMSELSCSSNPCTDHCPCLSAFVLSQSVTSTVFSGGISRTPLRATLHRYPPSRHVYLRSSGLAASTTGTRPISASSKVPYLAASSCVGNARIMSTGTSSFVRSWSEYSPSLPVPAPNTSMYTASSAGTSSRSCRLDQHTPRLTGAGALFSGCDPPALGGKDGTSAAFGTLSV